MVFKRSDKSDHSGESVPLPVKIIVAGGYAVGKTTFVGSISEIEPLTTEAALTSHSAGVDIAGEGDGLTDDGQGESEYAEGATELRVHAVSS